MQHTEGVRPELPLIARSAELSALSAAIEVAQRGTGVTLLVTGEAGIGKTRLLREAQRAAERCGLTVLRGRAVESGGAYRPLVEAFARPAAPYAEDPAFDGVRPTLARVLPGWSTTDNVLAPMADPAAVFAEALMMLLQRMTARGALLVLDDLHWADPDTISTLESIIDSAEGLALAVVLAARAEPQLPSTLQRLALNSTVRHLHLGRLTPTQVEQALLASEAPSAGAEQLQQLVTVVDGLPLILDELVVQIHESGSDQLDLSRSALSSTVQLRLSRVGENTRLVLDAMSILGETGVEVLSAATGLDVDDLAEGLRGGLSSTLLVPATGTALGVTWRHHLMADATRDLLLPLEQQAIARRAADHRSNRRDLSDGELRQTAGWYSLAGFPQQAAAVLVRAAQVAVRRAALDLADRYLIEAQSLSEHLPRGAADVLCQRIKTLVFAGRAGDAYDSGAAVLADARGSDARRLTVATARAAIAAGLFQDGRELLERLDREDAESHPELDVLRAEVALAERDIAAVGLGRSAVLHARAEGRYDLACEALIVVGRAARRRSPDESAAALREALELSRAHGLVVWEVQTLAEFGTIDMLSASDPTRLHQARDLAIAAGMLGAVAGVDVTLAQAAIPRDGYRAAYLTIRRADTQARQLRLTSLHAQAHAHLAECLILTGDDTLPGESRPSLRGEVDAVVKTSRALTEQARKPSYLNGIIAVRAWLDGDQAAADLIAKARWTYPGELQVPPWCGVAALFRVLGGVQPAVAFGPDDLIGHHTNHAAFHYAEAVWALRHGESAAAAIARAEELLQTTPFWRHLLRTVIAPIACTAGIREAEGWLREADAFFGEAGERPFQRRVRTALGRIGAKVPRLSVGSVPPHLARLGLTAREVEVLRLLNSGLTNTEIASRLVISVRTVETHVSNMLQKTGADDRRQLPVVDAG